MKTIEEKIGQLKKDTYHIKLELASLILPLITTDWTYVAELDLKINESLIRGVVKRSDVLFVQNDNAVEYSLLSLSIDELYKIYNHVCI